MANKAEPIDFPFVSLSSDQQNMVSKIVSALVEEDSSLDSCALQQGISRLMCALPFRACPALAPLVDKLSDPKKAGCSPLLTGEAHTQALSDIKKTLAVLDKELTMEVKQMHENLAAAGIGEFDPRRRIGGRGDDVTPAL